MLTQDQVINAGVKYLLIEAYGDSPDTQYTLILLQNETFDFVVDNPDHPQSVLTITGWDIIEDNDAKHDVIYEYLERTRTEEITNDEDFWNCVENIANELGIDCEWDNEDEDEDEDEPTNNFENDLQNIHWVCEWVEKPTFPEDSLEAIQQRICANWLTYQARTRIASKQLAAKALQGYTALLQPTLDNEHELYFRALIEHAQEILKKT